MFGIELWQIALGLGAAVGLFFFFYWIRQQEKEIIKARVVLGTYLMQNYQTSQWDELQVMFATDLVTFHIKIKIPKHPGPGYTERELVCIVKPSLSNVQVK